MCIRDRNLTVIKISESDESWLANLHDIDVFISCLASRSGEPKDAHYVDFELNNLLLEKAKAIKCSQFILLSAICVQKPKLAFQFEKLAFEEALRNSGLNFSIIRPTAYFKSLSGQIENIKKAINYYEKSAKMNDIEALANLGHIYAFEIDHLDPELSVKYLRKALDIDPGYGFANYFFGLNYYSLMLGWIEAYYWFIFINKPLQAWKVSYYWGKIKNKALKARKSAKLRGESD